MTPDPIDQKLERVGRSWREAQPEPPELDLTLLTEESPRGPRRWPMWAAAAATVAAIVAAYPLMPDGSDHRVTAQPSPAATVVTASPPFAADLVVRDGDRVRASGAVVARPGHPVRFCAPAVSPGVPPSFDSGVPSCAYAIVVSGVDIDRLSDAQERGGVRFGNASLTGQWHSGSLSVTEQGPPDQVISQEPFGPPPCPAPAGGWRAGSEDTRRLAQYVVDEHPDQFRRPWMSHPHEAAPSEPSQQPVVEVLVVEVVRGDVDAARLELQSRYRGNLCVVLSTGRPSIADQERERAAVLPQLHRLMADPGTGIYGVGGEDSLTVEMVVLTPDLHEKLTAIGRDLLDLRPWLRPVR